MVVSKDGAVFLPSPKTFGRKRRKAEEVTNLIYNYVDLMCLRVFYMLLLYGITIEIFSGGSWALYQPQGQLGAINVA